MLKHDIHDPVWFFDLEWVPDAAGAMRLYGLPPETSELEAMEHIWRSTNGYDAEKCPRPFVKYLLSRVVSIAFLSRRVIYIDGERRTEFSINSLPKLPLVDTTISEAEIIGKFLHYVGVREPQLVGYNSSESDIQVLVQRGMINEVRAESFCSRPDKPWNGRDYFDSRNGEFHLDLLKRFSRGAMAPRLNDLAKLCGFPGKIDVAGDQVVDLWLGGEVAKIVEYNQIDTLNTYLVWLRLMNFCGKLSEEEYFSEQEDFREFLSMAAAVETNSHIRRFIDKWEFD